MAERIAMRTVEQLRADFDVDYRETDACLQRECYWALLHMLLALPEHPRLS